MDGWIYTVAEVSRVPQMKQIPHDRIVVRAASLVPAAPAVFSGFDPGLETRSSSASLSSSGM